MLNSAVEAAKKNRTRYPFSLFGFVINFALLATWLLLALGPVFDQAKQLVPQGAYWGCNEMKRAAAQALDSIEQDINGAGKHLNSLAGKNVVKKLDFGKIIEKSLCVPLKKWVKKQAQKSIDSMQEEIKERAVADKAINKAEDSRRLQQVAVELGFDLSEAMKTWYEETALPHEVKLTLLHSKLHALWQEAQSLLQSAGQGLLNTPVVDAFPAVVDVGEMVPAI